jgi:hypothetical protein
MRFGFQLENSLGFIWLQEQLLVVYGVSFKSVCDFVLDSADLVQFCLSFFSLFYGRIVVFNSALLRRLNLLAEPENR